MTTACASFFAGSSAIEDFSVFVVNLVTSITKRDRHLLALQAEAEQDLADLLDEGDRKSALIESVVQRRREATERHPVVKSFMSHENTLAQVTFARGVDNFILYFRDLLGVIFREQPEVLRSVEHTETHEFILKHRDMDELIDSIIEKRMDVIDNQGMKAFRDSFSRMGLRLFEPDVERRVVELTERRNVVVHNRGIINARYVKLTGDNADRVGLPLELELFPMLKDLDFLARHVAEFDIRAAAKFGLATPNTCDEEG